MSDMIPGGYCRDCKYWNRHGVDDSDGGLCMMAESENGKPDYQETLAFAWSEDDLACFSTKADFGCVQWKRKSE